MKLFPNCYRVKNVLHFHFCLVLLYLLAFSTLNAQSSTTSTSQSPYFHVQSTDDTVETLPLRATAAKVNIAGVIADVEITQEYENTGQTPIEAIYVFPGSTQAAVYGMQMQIGDRIIEAEIAEKQAAREQYETAKSEGKRASLLEQERPNVFQMNVANIMPGDRIKVRLRYTELLVPEEGVYEFVYPTTVGPRYTDGSEARNNGYTNMPYTTAGQAAAYDFDLKVTLDGGMPVQQLSSPSHTINSSSLGGHAVAINLQDKGGQAANRDFILRYGFQADKIQTGMLVFDDGEEQFFLYMAQPPKKVEVDQIPPREYIFLMDVSGSMRGFPLDVSKTLMRNLIAELRPIDRFNILVFAGGNQLWKPESVAATADNLVAAENFFNTISGGGGTSLLPALQRCLELPRYTEGLARSIVVVSDGYVSVEDEAFELVRNKLNEANLFSFGIGSSVNRHLMEGLARAGQGAPFIVTDQQEAVLQAEKLRKYIHQPLFTRITPYFNGDINVYDLEPSSIPDVLSDRPVVLMGKLKGTLSGSIDLEGYVMEAEKASLWQQLKGEKPEATSKKIRLSYDLSKAQKSERYAAIRYLWAREKIRNLSDFNMSGLSEEDRQETIRLGLQYNLLTNFTSFVAIEKTIANETPADQETVKQALPMPAGVSNEAIGFELNINGITGLAIPAPEAPTAWYIYLLLGITILLLIGYFRFRALLPCLFIGIAVACFSSCTPKIQTAQPYDEITFILGQDQRKSNPYYETALKYFSTDSVESTPLLVSHCQSLHDVQQYLMDHAPDHGSWRKINLVAHGNQWTGINVPVIADGPRSSTAALKEALDEGILKPLPNELIDQHTTIAVLGCNVGKDTALLQQLSYAFGGIDQERPLVSSARYFNIFRDEGFSFSRHLAESHFISMPAGRFPGNQHIAKQFAQKYPDEDINWMKALLTLTPQDSRQPYVHYFNIPAEWTIVYPDSTQRPNPISTEEIHHFVSQQTDLRQELNRMQLDASAFQWQLSPTDIQGYPAIHIEGQTIIYCILEPVLNDQQQLISPAPDNPEYYALVR